MYSLKLSGAYIEITSYCNRDCPYCYNDSTRERTILDKEIIFKIIDECHSHNITTLSISGGEPFSHPYIYDILAKVESQNMKAIIITNLTFLPLEKAVSIARSGHMLQVTLDYPEKTKNDSTRGKGSYELVMQLFARFKEENLLDSIILRYNVGKNNASQIKEVIKIAHDFGIKTLDIAMLFKSGRGCKYEYVYDYKKDINEIGCLINQLQTFKKQYGEEFTFSYTKLNDQIGCVLFSDGVVPVGPKIEPNGNVYICQLFSGEENILGNVKNMSLQNILDSSKTKNIIDKIRKRKQIQNECPKCAFSDVCMCGCPAVSYNQTGNLFDKNDQCSMIKYFLKERIKEIGV